MTAVPFPTFGANGFVAPLESAILTGVQADINSAFGGVLNFTTSAGAITNPTPQGQLANSLAAIIGSVNSMFVLYTNLVDPAYSFGRMQDAIGRIYFLSRNPSTSTLVLATCTGLVGVTIPVGARAQDANGNIYQATQSGVIGSNGTVSIPFAAVTAGPIVCAAGALSIIYQAIPGWDAITNAAAGVTGTSVEAASAFETRRFASVAQNSIGALGSIRGAVLSVPNVIDCYVTENALNTTATVGGVSLLPNSLYVAVEGGLAAAVAQAIFLHKPPGAVYNGNTTVTVYDTQSGYTPPYPSYNVTFQTPINLPISFAVTMANNGSVPSNALALIQAALVLAFSGQDVVGYTPTGGVVNGAPVRIGGTVLASRFYPTLTNLWPGAQVVSILIGSPNNAGATFNGSISGTTLTVTSVSAGALAVGQIVDDLTGVVLPGTTIVSQTSGTAGGAGAYVVSVTQTVAAETMYGVAATASECFVNINQYPAIAAGNITLTLV